MYTPPEVIREKFELEEYPPLRSSYNVVPSQDVAAILNTEPNKAVAVKWGIVQYWAKDEKSPKGMINARAETLAEKRTFAPLLEKTRCVIPADGFYEWKATDEGKQPYRIEYKKGLFGFAGLWNEWQKEEGGPVHRFCAIITCAPNKIMHEIHDRMPVMLDPKQKNQWLEDGNVDLLKSFDDNILDVFPVSKFVNNSDVNRPEIMKPLYAKKSPNQFTAKPVNFTTDSLVLR